MWKNLYDFLLQSLTVTWAEFIQKNKSCGTLVRNNFQSKVYADVGLYLIVSTLIVTLFFYYYLNSKFGRYYSLKSWFIALLINSLLIGLLSYYATKSILDNPICDVSRHILWISIINASYAAILFFIVSIIFKIKSPMGKKTPF